MKHVNFQKVQTINVFGAFKVSFVEYLPETLRWQKQTSILF